MTTSITFRTSAATRAESREIAVFPSEILVVTGGLIACDRVLLFNMGDNVVADVQSLTLTEDKARIPQLYIQLEILSLF